jgi:hypothetical protein
MTAKAPKKEAAPKTKMPKVNQPKVEAAAPAHAPEVEDSKDDTHDYGATTYPVHPVDLAIDNDVMSEGEPCLLVARKATMKSLMVSHTIGCFTTKAEFAEEVETINQGRVVLFNSEQSISKVIRPRLMAAGADLSRVQIVPFKKRYATMERCLNFIQRQVEHDKKSAAPADRRLRLVVFDVVTSFLKATSADVREELTPVIAYCQQHKIALLMVLHLHHKGASDKQLLGLISGSQAWVQCSSMIWAMATGENTPHDNESHPWWKGVKEYGVFEVHTNNLGRSRQRWFYKCETVPVKGLKRPQPRLVMGDASKHQSVLSLLRATAKDDGTAINRSPREEAARWLAGWILEPTKTDPEYLVPPKVAEAARLHREGAVLVAARLTDGFQQAAKAAEVKWRTLERARADMAEGGHVFNLKIGKEHWIGLSASYNGGTGGGGAVGEGGTTPTKNGGGEAQEARLGDQGQAVH